MSSKTIEKNTALQNHTKEERVETINRLIQYISKHGRRFFYTKGTIENADINSVAFMKLKNGRIYFVDN